MTVTTSPIGTPFAPAYSTFPPTAIATLSGSNTADWDIKDHLGVSLRGVGGYNLGEYPYYKNEDAETVVAGLLARGIKVLRLVGFNRWCSNPSKGIGDSRIVSCPHKKSPRNRARLRAYAKACAKLGMWFIIVGEGDVLQGGTGSQDIYVASLALAAQYPDTIPGGALTWAAAGGFNIYTSPSLLGEFVEQWKDIVREFRTYPYLLGWEPMSEPLPAAGTWDPGSTYGTPGTQIYAGHDGAGEYGIEWTTGDTSVHETAESVFRRIISEIDKLDGVHPYIVGGTRGYDLSPQLTDLIAALKNSSALGGDLIAANKIIVTIDILSSGVTAHTVANKVITLLGTKVPCLINQLGTRHFGTPTYEDPTDEAIAAGISAMRAAGIIVILWEHISNTINGYGELYYPGGGDANQEGLNVGDYTLIDSGFRRDTVNTQFNYTLAALETARNAAAVAENLLDWYTEAFDGTKFPNLFKDEAATDPCTAIGDPVGAWLPKSDPQATGYKWCASTTARPTLGWMIDDGAGNSLLPHKRPALIFDGTNTQMMRLKTAGATPVETRYWGGASLTGAEVVFAMVGVRPNNLAQNQTFVAQGSTERFPRLYATIGKLPSIGFQGDSPDTLHIASGTTTVTPNNPMVVTGTKTGSAGSEIITTYVNGRQEGQITGQTVGSVAATSSTRVRLGGLSTNADFVGRLSSVALGRTALPSTAHRYDMGRHAAWLMGTGYPY